MKTTINSYYENLREEFLHLSPKQKKDKLDWIKECLSEINAGTFNVKRELNNPIRFWAKEHEQLVKEFSK